MSAYYNEIEPFKAEVSMREAIKAGRPSRREKWMSDIADVDPRFARVHPMSLLRRRRILVPALRLAGWPDDRPVWTASSPLPQLLSGRQRPRVWRPSPPLADWTDSRASAALQSSLESRLMQRLDTAGSTLFKLTWKEDYAVGKAVLGACSVGAPHIRQRLYFGADAEDADRWPGREEQTKTHGRDGPGRRGDLQAASPTYRQSQHRKLTM